jgi:hypothetical protein
MNIFKFTQGQPVSQSRFTARGHWAMGTVQIRQLILVGPEEDQRSSCGLMMWEREGGLSAGRGSVPRRRAQCRGGRPTSSDRAAGSVPPLCRGSGLSAAASARHCAGAAGSVPPLCRSVPPSLSAGAAGSVPGRRAQCWGGGPVPCRWARCRGGWLTGSAAVQCRGGGLSAAVQCRGGGLSAGAAGSVPGRDGAGGPELSGPLGIGTGPDTKH